VKVVREVDVEAPPRVVFAHFVDPARLSRWLGLAADLDPIPGGRFWFEIERGEHCEGEYLVVDPPHRVSFTWGWTNGFAGVRPGATTVEVVLEPIPTGTRVRVTHFDLPTEDARRLHDEGWSHLVGRLVEACVSA